MKRILISILTFILGICAVFIWFNSKSNELVKKTNLPIILEKKCAETENFPGLSQEIAKIEKGKSAYFPDKLFSYGWEGSDAFVNDWYGKHLKAANEKSLLDISDKDLEVYRFTWLRSFHHPVIVVIQKQSDEIKIVLKELDGAGGYEPGKIIVQKEISINENDWCKLKKFLNTSNYWQMPTEDRDLYGNDGARWILEGVKDGRYHLVNKWSPEKGEYREACIYLLKLSGFDFDKNKDVLY